MDIKALLVCSTGASTSILMNKMKMAAKNNNIKLTIEAMGIEEAVTQLEKWDIILIGPQVGFAKEQLKGKTQKPIEIIPADMYGKGNGVEVLKIAIKALLSK